MLLLPSFTTLMNCRWSVKSEGGMAGLVLSALSALRPPNPAANSWRARTPFGPGLCARCGPAQTRCTLLSVKEASPGSCVDFLAFLAAHQASQHRGRSSLPSGRALVLEERGPGSENEHRCRKGPHRLSSPLSAPFPHMAVSARRLFLG